MKLWSVILPLALAGAGGEKVAWTKPEAAFGASAQSGRPICWYFLSGEIVKGQPQAGC
jgi:hypothetical protein